MIYMFTLIRMGKDSKDRDKDWILCIYNINTIGDIRKENGTIFSLQLLLKCSPPCYFYNEVTYIESDFILTVSLSILFFLCSQSTDFYCYIRLDRCQASSLWSTVHRVVTQILLFLYFHHVATQYPGHGTKFVTLPSFYMSSILGQVLCVSNYVIVIIKCLMWLVLLPLCGHK